MSDPINYQHPRRRAQQNAAQQNPVPQAQYPAGQQYPGQPPVQQWTPTPAPPAPTQPAPAPAAPTQPVGSSSPTVRITGTGPKSWTSYWVIGGVAIGSLLLGLILGVSGSVAGLMFFGIFGVIVGVIALLVLWGARSNMGKTHVSAGPDGVWTPYFKLGWDQIRALDFINQAVRYTMIDPHATAAARRVQPSVVVTATETDSRGRPKQYGYTMMGPCTENFSEFRAAVRTLAPHVQFRTTLTEADFVVDQSAVQTLQQQFATTGRIAVSTKRGKEKLVFDRSGVTAEKEFVPWTAISALVAVTDLHTTSGSSDIGGSTFRTTRLVIVTNLLDDKGQQRRIRAAYDEALRPTIEVLLPFLRQTMPNVQIADQRTTTN